VLAKFNLSGFTALMLKDSAGVEVDSDIFDELLKSSQVIGVDYAGDVSPPVFVKTHFVPTRKNK
jgi:hypothetical protein